MLINNRVLVLIVLAQFCSASIWFASNGVMFDLIQSFKLSEQALADLTSSVQLGFIFGTLIFAAFSISDRFSPSKIFFISAIVGSIFNLSLILDQNTYYSLLFSRFFTGFFLAGIYPVGMKIAADYFDKALGKSLGFLVGALVLGTAFPHFLNSFTSSISWKLLIVFTSFLAVIGGGLIFFFVPDGPYRKAMQKLELTLFTKIFKKRKFRAAAFGYFGHMWELYAFWAFLPFILTAYDLKHASLTIDVSLFTFLIIAVGFFSCIIAGYLSLKFGSKIVAASSLTLSGIFCLISPLMYSIDLPIVFLTFLILWGMVVVSDSPMFSSLVADNAIPELKGSSLTIVNSIGFAITIISIQLLSYLTTRIDAGLMLLPLFIGPGIGLFAFLKRGNNYE